MSKKLKLCKSCGKEIAINAKVCPNCGGKNKKPIYKRWWFVIIVLIVIVSAFSTKGNESNMKDTLGQETGEATDIKEKESAVNNINETSKSNEEVNTNITKDVSTNETIGQKNALKAAKNYISIMAFSYDGLVKQLEFEKYSNEDAIYGADNCGADWNEQALKAAKNYLSNMAFSYDGLVKQLEFEKYTNEQAIYGVDNCGADWNEQAAKSAKNYLSSMTFSKEGLIEQLEFEGFTQEQAVFGAESNGY